MMTDVSELAKQAGFLFWDAPKGVLRDAVWKYSVDDFKAFAKLVIEAHNKQLLEGSVEPVAWMRPSVTENGIVYDSTFRDAVGCVDGEARIEQGFQPLYTSTQLEAAVLKERERCMDKISMAALTAKQYFQ